MLIDIYERMNDHFRTWLLLLLFATGAFLVWRYHQRDRARSRNRINRRALLMRMIFDPEIITITCSTGRGLVSGKVYWQPPTGLPIFILNADERYIALMNVLAQIDILDDQLLEHLNVFLLEKYGVHGVGLNEILELQEVLRHHSSFYRG